MTFTKRKNTCRSQPQCLVTRAPGKQPRERAGGERQSVGWHFRVPPLLALATKLSLVTGPRAAAQRHKDAPKDVLDAPEQRAIMTDCSTDAASTKLD
jgi:hypothetical protein